MKKYVKHMAVVLALLMALSVVSVAAADKICYIGDSEASGTGYSALDTAIRSADGKTIHLLSDATWKIESKDYFGERFVLDGGGHTVTLDSADKSIVVATESEFVFQNVIVDLAGKQFNVVNSGKIALKSGALIKNGAADNGGAAIINSGCEIKMESGSTITGCTANYGGGALHVNGGTAIITGGTISGNTAAGGSGLYVAETGTVKISGDANITGNKKKNGDTNNITLKSESSLKLSGKLTKTVGITFGENKAGEGFGAAESGAAGAENFVSDLSSGIIGAISGTSLVWTSGKGGNASAEVKTDSGTTPATDDKTEVKPEKVKKEESTYVSKTGWKITVNSYKNPPERMIDGNKDTYWHSGYTVTNGAISAKDNAPFIIDITLPQKTVISGAAFLPRQDSNASGIATSLALYGLIDGEYRQLGSYTYANAHSLREEKFKSNIEVSGIRVEVLEGVAGYGTMAEIDLIAEDKGLSTVIYDEFVLAESQGKLYPIDKKKVSASYEGDTWGTNVISRAVDSQASTFFQVGSPKANYTVTLDVDLGKSYKLSAIGYLPRQGAKDGFWQHFKILSSTDGVNYTDVTNVSLSDIDWSWQTVKFDEPVTARYFRYNIMQGFGNLVSVAELDFYEDFAEYTRRREQDSEKYALIIGDNKITHKKGEVMLDTAPFIDNGTTFIPLRGLLELMGATVSWNGEDESVTVTKDDTNIYLQIQSLNVLVKTPKYGEVQYTLLAAPRIKDNRTFIPIRFVSEQLGYDVNWNGETKTVTITK